jgi:hypothetical protein
VAYLGLNDQQRQDKQTAAHKLGSAAHKQVAQALGILTSKGKPAWAVVAQAGGATAFKGASAQESAALAAKGVANAKGSIALAQTVSVALIHEAQSIEAARFERILTASGAMDSKDAQKWLNNPSTTLARAAGRALITAINSDAVRAMATEEYGRPLGDKEWAAVSEEKKWKKFQNSKHMGVVLAAQRATKIFEILLEAPLQLAKDYMSATIICRQKNTDGYLARPKKS